MRKLPLFIILTLLPALFAMGRLHGQTAIQASTTANVFARVLSCVKTPQFNFGHFYSGSFDGQLINNPDGILSVKGDIDKGEDIHFSTIIDLSGNGNTAFTMSIPNSPVTLTNISDAKTLTIGNWKSASLPTTAEGELPIGYRTVNLDATLKLGSSNENPFGFYSGYYTIIFGFN